MDEPPPSKKVDDPVSTPEAPPAPTIDPVSDKAVEAARKPPDNNFDVNSLWSGLKKLGVPTELPSAFTDPKVLLGGGDKADKPTADAAKPVDARVGKALSANAQADAHDSLYSKMLGKHTAEKLEPGEHKSENGSSYKVNEQGQISEFKTGPLKDFPEGMHYKNIKYDANGQMSSYEGPKGHIFKRHGETDKDGFGTWTCQEPKNPNRPGEPPYAVYSGSQSHVWRGKAMADESGFHTMIASSQQTDRGYYNAKNAGTLFSRTADGTTIESRKTQSDAKGYSLQTKMTSADGNEATRASRVEQGKVDGADEVRLKETGKAETKVTVDADKNTGKVVEPPKAPDKPPGPVEKIADKVIKRVADSPNPIQDLTKALNGLDNLRSAEINRVGNGSYHVKMDLERPTYTPPPNINVRGFTPNATRVNDPSFFLTPTQTGVSISGMQGFDGSVTGPRGRVRDSWTNSMHITKDQMGRPCVDVQSSVQGPFRVRGSSSRLYKEQLPEGPMRQMLDNPDGFREIAGSFRMFQKADELQNAKITKTGNDAYAVSTEARQAKHIELNQKLKDAGVEVKSIDVDKKMSGNLSHDANGARLSDIKGLTVKLNTLLGEQTVTPKKVGMETNEKGVPVVKIEVELNGVILPFEVEASKLKR